jgi:hypothetical protein
MYGIVYFRVKGGLKLLKLEHQRTLTEGQAWSGLHGAGGVTGLAAHGDALAAVGQDGKINVLNVRQPAPTRVRQIET